MFSMILGIQYLRLNVTWLVDLRKLLDTNCMYKMLGISTDVNPNTSRVISLHALLLLSKLYYKHRPSI